MTSQWQGLLKNLATWEGSFTQCSPEGVVLADVPSTLALTLSEDEKTVHLLLKRDSRADIALQFNYPGPGPQIPFFETGCFSQGSLQWSPYGRFGAEFSLIEGDRRLRLVQMYPQGPDLGDLTLIREYRAGSTIQESPPLSFTQLVGTWEGSAITLYPDARNPEHCSTQLQVQQDGDRLTQTLQFGTQSLQSSGRREGNVLHFENSPQPMQLTCLPGGASSLCPRQIQRQVPFVTEVGWLVEPNLRKRLVRRYSESGAWQNITLVTERKLG